MPMERDAHESLLTDLLNPDLEQSRRTEILQQLRVDYGTVLAEHSTLMQERDSLKANNDDLIVSNSKLFRQLGVVGGDKETQKKEEEKSFSETITLSALENK